MRILLRSVPRFLYRYVIAPAGFLFWFVVVLRYYNHVQFAEEFPPFYIDTIGEFVDWHPNPGNVSKIEVRGVTYYSVLGNRARLLWSGPSEYLFDARGNFVGWSRDSGDYHYPEVIYSGYAKRSPSSLGQIPTN